MKSQGKLIPGAVRLTTSPPGDLVGLGLFLTLSLGSAIGCRSSGDVAGEATGKAVPTRGQAGSNVHSIASLEALRKERAQQQAAAVTNPENRQPYAGPVGSIRGVVRVTGEPPPAASEAVTSIPDSGCDSAHTMYSRRFRRGPNGTLGDAFVAVTGYEAYLPAPVAPVVAEIRGCAWNARTYALTFGQHLEVVNRDAQSYMPHLQGTPTPALRVAVGGGAPVPLFVNRPGAYKLVGETRPYMTADVIAVAYPTTAVTDLDGRFEVSGLPPGEVDVTAFSPAIGLASKVSKRAVVKAGESTEVLFTIEYRESP